MMCSRLLCVIIMPNKFPTIPFSFLAGRSLGLSIVLEGSKMLCIPLEFCVKNGDITSCQVMGWRQTPEWEPTSHRHMGHWAGLVRLKQPNWESLNALPSSTQTGLRGSFQMHFLVQQVMPASRALNSHLVVIQMHLVCYKQGNFLCLLCSMVLILLRHFKECQQDKGGSPPLCFA